MTNVCLIGYGKWGKKVLSSLKEIKTIKKIYIIKSRNDKKKKINNISWVFVTTNISNHFSVVKKFLEKKINVFCEKPLTNNLKNDIILFKTAKKNNCKLYVSDIENYKRKKIKLANKNIIIRSKFSNNKKNILKRLTYHDFTYLYKLIKNKKFKNLKIIESNFGILHFSIKFDNKLFIFKYDLNSKIKKHKFNNQNLITTENILKKMLTKVINDDVDYALNKKISIFSNRITNVINEKI